MARAATATTRARVPALIMKVFKFGSQVGHMGCTQAYAGTDSEPPQFITLCSVTDLNLF